ncbi:MAG: choice-of-anchor tandem repeat GloVer-containing protein [Candidatus Sulfotelmatobacter sp.]
MKKKSTTQHSSTVAQALLLVLAIFLSAVSAHAGEKVIFQFNENQGFNPSTGLISDSAGNFYGTASGGIGNCSNVYELSPDSNGSYTETILYTFQNCDRSGLYPIGALSIDKNGNLYGAEYGFSNADGSGLVYELTKQTNGTFTYSVLHNFGGNEGGPFGDFAWDSAGNLYGATFHDSTTFDGEVFELSPQSNGSWKETVLYRFPSPDGVGGPAGSVVFDSQGNLYGALYYGLGGSGQSSRGAIYELAQQSSGPWKLILLYNFTAGDSAQFPDSRLTFDSSSNLYGTSQGAKYGAVFELSPASGGKWTETTIHSFTSGRDGANPVGATLVFNASGNLYGTTPSGGIGCNRNLCGVVYKLSPQRSGTWKETIVHTFESAGDGSEPGAGLLLDSAGNLYGTTYHGGSRYGYGTVYEITP